jgi:hypothetical protein
MTDWHWAILAFILAMAVIAAISFVGFERWSTVFP